MNVWHTDLETQKGKPGHGIVLEPKRLFNGLSWRAQALCRWGVLSSIVL